MSTLTDLSLADMKAGLAAKQISAVELAQAHLDAMAANRHLNAYIVETPELALAQAKAVDDGARTGPLAGIPLGIKDLFAVEGVQTTAGSNILKGFVPRYESSVTANLLRDGAVFLGKLNMDEFAMGSSNETSAFGRGNQPVEGKGFGRRTGARRLVRRFSGGGFGTAVRRGHRHRYRRLHSSAGRIRRHRRHQADLRPRLALGHHRVCLVA